MIAFRSLLGAELRRCLSRRAVKVLVGVALLGIVVMLVVTVLTVEADPYTTDPHITRLGDLWRADGDGVLFPAFVLLVIGAFIGGAVVVGGEWKAGTVLTLATWEVRRGRLVAARLAACAILAAAIGAVLLALYVAATLPVVLARGSTAGVDGAWALRVVGATARGLGLVALAAVIGAAVANIARNATAALAAVFVLQSVAEPVLRTTWPRRSGWLVGENLTVWLMGITPEGAPFSRSTLQAGLTLLAYTAVLVAVAVAVFRRRDLGAATG